MKGTPTTALVLAIVSWLFCPVLLAIPALMIANDCLATGTSEPGIAQAAKIVALVNIIGYGLLALLWILAVAGIVAIAGIGAAAGG